RLDLLGSVSFTTILLSPIMENADRGYHGYWVEDFYSIEDQFGDEEALENLIESAHERDIKVVLELVTNYSAESLINKEEQATDEWYKENEITSIYANDCL